ncbi:DNA-directed DNA polymerase alpha catalytic subunit pol1 [Blastocladiella emersonii ATCC 22665]|nr:DNA-directed DNA polymerase alpha catalytic subunit pol1 [Blastocladiella emersonii ATCC 22665]
MAKLPLITTLAALALLALAVTSPAPADAASLADLMTGTGWDPRHAGLWPGSRDDDDAAEGTTMVRSPRRRQPSALASRRGRDRDSDDGSLDPWGWAQAMQDEMRRMMPTSLLHWAEQGSAMHIRETDTEYVYFVDAPGMRASDIGVTLEQGRRLRVKATRKCEAGDAYCVERRITHEMSVDDDVDPKKVSVNLDSGVLRIHLPKKSATRSFTIPVIDSLFGLNQPSKDRAEQVPVHKDSGAASASGTAARVIKDAAGSVQDAAYGAADAAAEAAGRAKESAGWLKHQAASGTENMADALRDAQAAAQDRAGYVADQARDAAGRMRDAAADQSAEAKNQAGGMFDWLTEKVAGVKEGAADAAEGAREGARDGYIRGQERKRAENK